MIKSKPKQSDKEKIDYLAKLWVELAFLNVQQIDERLSVDKEDLERRKLWKHKKTTKE